MSRGSILTVFVPAGALALASAPTLARATETVIPIAGEVPEGGLDHFFVEFEVPDGIVEIEIRHDDLSEMNILDWGLEGPKGSWRGWGGGTDSTGGVDDGTGTASTTSITETGQTDSSSTGAAADPPGDAGCGCATKRSPPWILGLLAIRRRRSAR